MKQNTTKISLQERLQNSGMIDFSQFTSPAALQESHILLKEYLSTAKERFKKLLKTPVPQASYESVVLPHLTSDSELGILFSFIDTLNSVNASDETRAIIEKFEPQMVAFGNEVSLSAPLYALLGAALKKTKRADEKRSIQLLMRDMKHAGVTLDDKKRKRVAAINKELSALGQKFENNVIDSRKLFSYVIENEAVLGYMPKADVNEAREMAQAKGKNGAFLFTLLPPQYAALMKYCTDRSIRQKFYEENNKIATSGKFDNRKLILKILSLRNEKAKLLGFKNFAQYALEIRMAPSEKKVLSVMDSVYKKALPAAKKEVALLDRFAHEECEVALARKEKFSEWDVPFYSDRYRRSYLKFDDAKLREYFELNVVIAGLFDVCKKLYGITFKEIQTGVYADGVRVYEVYRANKLVSYYVADFYARPSKRGGAWCNMLREGFVHNEKAALPIMINVMNFAKPSKEFPSLLMHRDVETLFHEFGHAVHAILSSNQLPNLNGFHVEWDFVEFPSQIFENWTWEKSVLNDFAKHYKTGAVLPQSDINAMWKLKTWLGGYHVVRQNEFGSLDMALHSVATPKSVAALDALCYKIVSKRTVLPKPKGYAMYASFGHIFAGGYSAGYYSYLWAEILEADCYEFLKKKGIVSASTGALFAQHILEPGTREPGIKLFTSLLKRNARVEPLLKKYGIN